MSSIWGPRFLVRCVTSKCFVKLACSGRSEVKHEGILQPVCLSLSVSLSLDLNPFHYFDKGRRAHIHQLSYGIYRVPHVCGWLKNVALLHRTPRSLLVLHSSFDRAPVESILYINAYSNWHVILLSQLPLFMSDLRCHCAFLSAGMKQVVEVQLREASSLCRQYAEVEGNMWQTSFSWFSETGPFHVEPFAVAIFIGIIICA